MKKFLLIAGILLLILGGLSLALGFLFRFAYMHTLDGSADMYAMQMRMQLIFLISGGTVSLLGAAALIVRSILK